MAGKIPVTIFTGFLGSGKTTLLTSLVAAEKDRRFAAIINEFGTVSIDDLLVESALDPRRSKVYKLSGGLIAYEGDEFKEAMLEIAASGLIDHVLIETSGLAVPTAAMEALNSPELFEKFSIDAVLAIVDTPNLLFKSDISEAEMVVFQSQLQASDVVVLNKIDRLESKQMRKVESRVRELAPMVRFVELSGGGKLDSRVSLGLHLNEFRALEHIPGLPAFAATHNHGAGQAGHSHSGLGAHEHGIGTHEHLHEEDPGWLSFALTCKAAQNQDALLNALNVIAKQLPLLRVKGFVHCHNLDGHLLIQGVKERIEASVERDEHHGHAHDHEHIHDHDHHHNHEHSHEHDHAHAHTHTHEHHHDHAPHSDHEHSHDHAHSHDHDHEHHHHEQSGSLVFIGYHLDRNHTIALLSEHTGTTWH